MNEAEEFKFADGVAIAADAIGERRDFMLEQIRRVVAEIAEIGAKKNGRGTVQFVTLPGVTHSGPRTACIRKYLRGGWVGSISSDKFLSVPSSRLRPIEEFKALQKLRTAGCAVPEPLMAAAVFGPLSIFYRAAIATGEVPASRNLLAALLDAQIDRLGGQEMAKLAGSEAAKILEAGIIHTDLHPGNVLCQGDRVWIVDFDKSATVSGLTSLEFARARILSRWNRSADKHGLDYLKQPFEVGLRG